jgi:hypothetical protein
MQLAPAFAAVAKMSLDHKAARAGQFACLIRGQELPHVIATVDRRDRRLHRIVNAQPMGYPARGRAQLLTIGLSGLNGLHGIL